MRLLTLRSVLVATTLDEASGLALRTAARLAQLAGAGVHLVHVTDNWDIHDEDRLRQHFRSLVPDIPEPDSVRVLVGSPAEMIAMHAVRVGADAVILGPHRGAGAHGVLGSTAASVVRAAPCPCLVAAAELRLPIERVLVPIDLSDAAEVTLAVALTWASALRPRSGEAHILALHISANGPTAEPVVRSHVEHARQRAGGVARVDIQQHVSSAADPATEILRCALSGSADLLVVGTRGGNKTAGLGSVSAAIARQAPCPLLLVPPDDREESSSS